MRRVAPSLRLLQAADLAWLAFLALFGTLATFWLQHHAARHIAPASLLAYSYLSTLCALLIQAGLNRQLPSTDSWIGAAAILLGLLWLAWRCTPRPAADNA
jgi:drug/metabolite transporter (DMT)-like permease